jgi:hypothetical protein
VGILASQCTGSHELIFAIASLAIAGTLCWLACLRRHKGMGLANASFNSLIFSHLLVSMAGYIWISDITIGWLVVNVWHNIQYLIFVYRQQRTGTSSFNDGIRPNCVPVDRKSLIKLLKPPTRYFLICFACGAAIYGIASGVGESLLWLGFPTILIAHLILNFHHYLADSFIWKRRRT